MHTPSPDRWKLARLCLCVAVIALLLVGGAAVRLQNWWASVAAGESHAGTARTLPPFRDPTHPDPFCRLWRQMDEGAYSYHLFKTRGIILTTDEWRD